MYFTNKVLATIIYSKVWLLKATTFRLPLFKQKKPL